MGVTFLLPSLGSEAGLQQTLAATLEPLTAYTLTVEVGNLAYDGGPYAFTGFPGYRIDLLAGATVLASDDDTLLPAEGRFLTSTVQFVTGASHPNTGEALGIRLVNLDAAAGIEVNFDDVRLDAAPVSPCPVSPPAGCKAAATGKGALAIHRKIGNPARSRLTWNWKGQATSLPELADPTTTADYRLCLYDGGTAAVLDLGLAAAGVCGIRPCWKESSSGFIYRDAAGTAGGVTVFSAKAGSDGKSVLRLRAKGANLASPDLPLVQSPSPVRVAVINEGTGACWLATYSTPPADPTSMERWRSKND